MKRWVGFTLIELLAVIAIIGILATLSLGSFAAVQRRSRDNRRKTDLNLIAQAVDQYYGETRSLPCGSDVAKSTDTPKDGSWIPGLSPNYLPAQSNQRTIPVDPKNDNDHYYSFQCVNDGIGSYKLEARLEGTDTEAPGGVYTIEH